MVSIQIIGPFAPNNFVCVFRLKHVCREP